MSEDKVEVEPPAQLTVDPVDTHVQVAGVKWYVTWDRMHTEVNDIYCGGHDSVVFTRGDKIVLRVARESLEAVYYN